MVANPASPSCPWSVKTKSMFPVWFVVSFGSMNPLSDEKSTFTPFTPLFKRFLNCREIPEVVCPLSRLISSGSAFRISVYGQTSSRDRRSLCPERSGSCHTWPAERPELCVQSSPKSSCVRALISTRIYLLLSSKLLGAQFN